MHWLYIHLGLNSGNSPWYLFPSGAFGYVAVFSFLWAVIVFYRRHNCEVHGCWRLGRHDTAAGHTVCRVHHPDGHLTADDVVKAHQAAQNPYPPHAERRA